MVTQRTMGIILSYSVPYIRENLSSTLTFSTITSRKLMAKFPSLMICKDSSRQIQLKRNGSRNARQFT